MDAVDLPISSTPWVAKVKVGDRFPTKKLTSISMKWCLLEDGGGGAFGIPPFEANGVADGKNAGQRRTS